MFDELMTSSLNTTWGQRSAWAVFCCASVLAIYTFFHAFFLWYADASLSKRSMTMMAAHQTDRDMLKRIMEIPRWHLFGEHPDTMPVTSMQLRLIGIIESVPPGESTVLISEAEQTGKVYRVGDTLSSGVKVHAITQDGVILQNAGRLEKLPLQRSPLLFQGPPQPLLPEGNAP